MDLEEKSQSTAESDSQNSAIATHMIRIESVFESLFVGVHACMHAWVCVCVCTCVYAIICMCMYECVCVCVSVPYAKMAKLTRLEGPIHAIGQVH